SNCGHKKVFKFYAPFIDESKKENYSKIIN
ncbi:TPA: metal-binding protein, partial [Clostridium botulinum]